MFTDNPKEFLVAFEKLQNQIPFKPNTMRAALLISPRGVQISEQSSIDNVYMDTSKKIDIEKAFKQHQNVARTLNELNVPVVQFSGAYGHDDDLFPNNIFATIPGYFIIGKMFHQVRQQEANRVDIRDFFTSLIPYKIKDLSEKKITAELTGSLVIDRSYEVGFTGIGNRCDVAGAKAMHEAFEHKLTYYFDLKEDEYHTNIILSNLAGKASIIYPGAFQDVKKADIFFDLYKGRTIEIDEKEKNAFCGNSIAVTKEDALFSQTSLDNMRDSVKNQLELNGFKLHGVEIDEIEKCGGSMRCLICEIF